MIQGEAEKEDLRRRLEELEVELRVEQEGREGGGGRGRGEAGLPTNGDVLLYDPGAAQQEQEEEVENVMVMEVVQQQIPCRAGRKSRQGGPQLFPSPNPPSCSLFPIFSHI